ncbi:MAG: hypothetical protein JO162_00865, partial [Alphaproteobacteria bacterium]|nr:hypothetical protein [Alphaproteobacteria bacterium]
MADLAEGQARAAAAVAAPAEPARLSVGPWSRAALVGLVLLAVALRLVPTVFVPSLNWGDEIF